MEGSRYRYKAMSSVYWKQKKNVYTPLHTREGLGVGLLLVLLLFSSCSVDLPSYVISEGKMENILHDYHLAQGMAEAEGGDVEKNRYIYVQKVFEKHNITEADFDTSMVWYSGHANHLSEIYKRIDARLERESRDAGLNIPEEDKYARFTAEGDTANIWQGNEMHFLMGNREDNLYTLIIPADTSFHKGDHFMLRFGNHFICQDNQREGHVLLQVRYENDSTIAATNMVTGDNDLTVTLNAERVKKDQDIKSIACTFYYAFDESLDDAFRLWVITKPVLLRYHVSPTDSTTNYSVRADSIPNDTLRNDTTDSVTISTGERLTPEAFRRSQNVERRIHVVGRQNYALPQKNVKKDKR